MSDAGPEALAAPESVSPADRAISAPTQHATEVAELAWTVNPAAHSLPRALVVGGMLVAASLLAGQVMQSALLGGISFAFLFFSLRAFFLPRHYCIDASGAGESGPLSAPRRVAWSDVKRIQTARFGVWVSERHNSSRMLPAHGVFLRTQGNRGAVLAAAQHAHERARAAAASSNA